MSDTEKVCEKIRTAVTDSEDRSRYEQVKALLLDSSRYGKKHSIEEAANFLRVLGNPCSDRKIIHVAGTNGKGSVCAYLESVLRTAGYRTGMFTSPHLVTMRERIRINGEMIGRADFVRYFNTVERQLQTDSPEERSYRPAFFEMLFFMALLCFEENDINVILLETGLGGRLDVTNCVSRKELCIITEIGLDHTEYLGNTIAKIAGEKAGILRQGVPVVFADHNREASAVIAKKAGQLACPVFSVSNCDVRKLEFHRKFIDFSFNTRYYGYIKCLLKTCASYQTENAALALRALDVLGDRLPVSEKALAFGMARAHWQGRMDEVVPDVFIDGAHNEDGILAFLDTVRRDGCRGRRLLLFSAVREKQYREIAGLIRNEELFDRIYLTKMQNTRSLSRQELQEAFGAPKKGVVCGFDSTGEALQAMMGSRRPGDKAYIAGSLYLAGEVIDDIKRNRYD